eukprot:1161586-Pelagomonas_calceolata.AAC.2
MCFGDKICSSPLNNSSPGPQLHGWGQQPRAALHCSSMVGCTSNHLLVSLTPPFPAILGACDHTLLYGKRCVTHAAIPRHTGCM